METETKTILEHFQATNLFYGIEETQYSESTGQWIFISQENHHLEARTMLSEFFADGGGFFKNCLEAANYDEYDGIHFAGANYKNDITDCASSVLSRSGSTSQPNAPPLLTHGDQNDSSVI